MTTQHYSDAEKRDLLHRKPNGFAVGTCLVCGNDHQYARAVSLPKTCGLYSCQLAKGETTWAPVGRAT